MTSSGLIKVHQNHSLLDKLYVNWWPSTVCCHGICGHSHDRFRPLQWRHNERDGVSNHRHLHCLLHCCFRRRSKKTSKLRVTGVLWEEFAGGRWIPHIKGQKSGKCFHLMTSSCYTLPAKNMEYFFYFSDFLQFCGVCRVFLFLKYIPTSRYYFFWS